MQTRSTKYSKEILDIIQDLSHATNLDILEKLREHFPSVSATTVHRITARLIARGLIAKAPSDSQGSMMFDANLIEHDHFICSICGRIRDIDVADKFIPKISRSLGGCVISGRLVIFGDCDKCKVKLKQGINK